MSKYIYLMFVFILLLSCKKKTEDNSVHFLDEKEISSALVEVNRSIVKRNRNHIINFVKRTGWEMTESESGIWFGILKFGNGKKVIEGDHLQYEYVIRLIDGSYPENNEENLLNNITIGKGGVESGLEKGLLLMSEGDSARIIVPPYLGHGNFGDGKNIPPGAILIFDVRVLNIDRSQSE